MIKIKDKPEDFVVEEIAVIPLTQTGNFCLYLLKKRGWNTVDVLKNLSRKRNLPSPMFNIRKLRQAFSKGIERNAVVIPEELSVDYSDDEIYQGKKKLVLDFFLPRGCFGTIFIKRIFS